MTVYISNGEIENVIFDLKGDDYLMKECFLKVPSMKVKKASDDEIRRLKTY